MPYLTRGEQASLDSAMLHYTKFYRSRRYCTISLRYTTLYDIKDFRISYRNTIPYQNSLYYYSVLHYAMLCYTLVGRQRMNEFQQKTGVKRPAFY